MPVAIEIEAKMRIADPAELETRLAACGATRGPVLTEANTFFDTSSGTLKAGDQGLRIRVERSEHDQQETTTITHKGPRAHGRLKSRSETEARVENARDAAELLSALGFYPTLGFEKKRRRWTLDGCHVDIDSLPHIGHFVEIEGPSDKAVLSVRERLGLANAPLIQASYIAILADYLAAHRIRTDFIGFEPASKA